MATIKELKDALKATGANWRVNENLLDSQEIPKYFSGGTKEGLPLAKEIGKIDFAKMLAAAPANHNVHERRISRGILAESTRNKVFSKEYPSRKMIDLGEPPEGGEPLGGAPPAIIDWRDRFGWPWITSIRDQDSWQACWVFASVALIESMSRIEHGVWSTRSEGDVLKGMGSNPTNTGSPQMALDWIKINGVADPDCFPFSNSDVPYKPTADRPGRIVKIADYSYIGNLDDQKTWLDTIGPIITFFKLYEDFGALGKGIYKKMDTFEGHPNNDQGSHYMLVVGYDDSQNCWIVKNSWGSKRWGDNGYGRIAYGECDIDTYAKIGLFNTDPDPWTKRRMHNGNTVESSMGGWHRNFEMLAKADSDGIRYCFRDNSVMGSPVWLQGVKFGADASSYPTLVNSTYWRNLECVFQTTSHQLHHWWLEQANGTWMDGGVFGPPDVGGVPGFVQSNYNAPGNFEVVVRTTDGKLNHWWRDGNGWHDGGRFAGNVAFSGASLLQSHFGEKGNFELVCVLKSGKMQHWTRDNDHHSTWKKGKTFGSQIHSPPCMIEGQFNAKDEKDKGNFELCVAVGGRVQHWWMDHKDRQWHQGDTFGHDIKLAVGLIEGSYAFNLELIVLRTDNQLQHYWRENYVWYEGPIIVVNG